MVGKGWWYSWIFVDGHTDCHGNLFPKQGNSAVLTGMDYHGFTRTIMDLPGKIGGVASPGAQRCLERPGCGRERTRSSQSESTRRPEALELRISQLNP